MRWNGDRQYVDMGTLHATCAAPPRMYVSTSGITLSQMVSRFCGAPERLTRGVRNTIDDLLR